ncbi:hypothetical protein V7111_13165 [Neobacillus niacini]|uniref:hypothetical protein n=1 Tax=Neobacillus niacini TaxID=86668 RepID=UPI002FFE2A54
MKKKLFVLLAGTVLSVSMLAGCNKNQNPPPPVNNEAPLNNTNTRYNDNNRLNNTNTRYNENNRLNNTNTRYNDGFNNDNGNGMLRDRNINREDIIEDKRDVNDRDTIDE